MAAVAVRLERERGIFEPYDVIREGRVLAALAETNVPVPAMVGDEPDPSVLGARFIVMEWVEAPHMGVAGPEGDFGAFVEMVTRIHGTEWRGLLEEVLPVPRDAQTATLGEIRAVEARMPGFGIAGGRLADMAGELRARVPAGGELSLCQGDINVFNYLFRRGEVVAVVDWEQARIGDARSDVGQLMALSHLKGVPWVAAEDTPFAMSYAALREAMPPDLGFFRAFWLWQLAVIHRGWVAFNGSQPWYGEGEVMEMLERALGELG